MLLLDILIVIEEYKDWTLSFTNNIFLFKNNKTLKYVSVKITCPVTVKPKCLQLSVVIGHSTCIIKQSILFVTLMFRIFYYL